MAVWHTEQSPRMSRTTALDGHCPLTPRHCWIATIRSCHLGRTFTVFSRRPLGITAATLDQLIISTNCCASPIHPLLRLTDWAWIVAISTTSGPIKWLKSERHYWIDQCLLFAVAKFFTKYPGGRFHLQQQGCMNVSRTNAVLIRDRKVILADEISNHAWNWQLTCSAGLLIE